ncbi:PepSY domain-containing protein [Robertkochia solimangrovi]|nr:PepSY-associated TM helix domain-containing protein [Robertkochia solimangrovi]TRZ41947.1 PepSY domain-containing protein [Robertkochia solimangrovi]
MKQRTYNILFHTHTVSGIVISVVLYVIFFAGSFAFFRDEFVNWERNSGVDVTDHITFSFDHLLDSVGQNYNLYGRDIELSKYYIEDRVSVNMTGTQSKTAASEDQLPKFFYYTPTDNSEATYAASYTLGEFLYRLHFLAQIKYPIGYYLAGLIAFFFLFAIITGFLVHWKKIVSNFYIFRPMAKAKTIWTDAHTALGMIGLPFQFVYAVTGAFFMIKAILIAPNVFLLFNGDQEKFYAELGYSHPHSKFIDERDAANYSIDEFVETTRDRWPGFNVTQVHLFNYQTTDMQLLVEGHLPYRSKFNGTGQALYQVNSGKLISERSPLEKASYLEAVKNILYRIHYGDYGGYALRIISFLLGIISCFVIISGVMIWLVARDKKHIPEKRRRFNEKVARVYMAIALSMLPVTALSFIAVKIFEPQGQSFIINFYGITWLLFTIFYILKKDLSFINRNTLLLGAVFGLLIPITNGIKTGNWPWVSYEKGLYHIFFTDVFWIILPILLLFAWKKTLKSGGPGGIPQKKVSKKTIPTKPIAEAVN